ncbi:hypothetical protein D9M71_640050 [compost metagenome]
MYVSLPILSNTLPPLASYACGSKMSMGMSLRSWLKSAPHNSSVLPWLPSGVRRVTRLPNTSLFCIT